MSAAFSERPMPDERPHHGAYTGASDATGNAADTDSSTVNPGATEPGVFAEARSLLGELGELAHDQMQIVSLETQRVGESFVSMVVYGLAVGLLAVTAWLGLIGVLVLWLIHAGVIAPVALLIAVVLNLAAALGLIFAIRARSDGLRFSSTMESFRYIIDMIKQERRQ